MQDAQSQCGPEIPRSPRSPPPASLRVRAPGESSRTNRDDQGFYAARDNENFDAEIMHLTIDYLPFLML